MVSKISPVSPNSLDFQLQAYDYDLPVERIAQNPVVPRDRSRLLVIHGLTHSHHHFYDLPQLLQPGDLLILNDTRVIPARLYGHKPEGAKVEVLLLEDKGNNCWLALVKPGRRLKPGATIIFPNSELRSRSVSVGETPNSELVATVLSTDRSTGGRLLQFEVPEGTTLWDWIEAVGEMPLPPYITQSEAQPDQYQTVYNARSGAVAAPTAGLHFTPELLQALEARGIEHRFITLHVGVGTFRPVETEEIMQHQMHEEWVEVPAATVEKIRQTQAQGGRIIAVGTTVVRSLEGAAQSGSLQPFRGKVNLFIYPGYQWRVIEGLITNFHLPRSSLLMLVSALIGRERLLKLYQEAIERQYRFYSFGDAMLILPIENH
jgi:S-adenosylmethionine:tRNA ribosyltransferase-isomerase